MANDPTHPCSPNYDPYHHKRGGPPPAIFGSWANVDAYLATSNERAKACANHRQSQQNESAYAARLARQQQQNVLDAQAAARAAQEDAARQRAERQKQIDAERAAAYARRKTAEQIAARNATIPCGAGQVRDPQTGRCVGNERTGRWVRDDPNRVAGPNQGFGAPSYKPPRGCLFVSMTPSGPQCTSYAPGYGPKGLQRPGPWRDEVNPLTGGTNMIVEGSARAPINFGGGSIAAPSEGLLGSIGKFIGDAVTGVIPGTWDDNLWNAAKKRLSGGDGSRGVGQIGGATGGTRGFAAGNCGAGTTYDPSTGLCKVGGLGGVLQRGIPGGQSGYVSQGGTPAVPAVQATGSVAAPAIGPREPIYTARRTCGPGYRLAVDGMCYPKGTWGASSRYWANRPKRAVVSYSDGKTLQKAERIANRHVSFKKRARRVGGKAKRARSKK